MLPLQSERGGHPFRVISINPQNERKETMKSEIVIGTYSEDQKPVIEFRKVKLTHLYPIYRGVSQKTGEEFVIQHFNVELTLGEDVKRNYMKVTAYTKIAKEMEGVAPGDIVDIQVDINVSGSKFPTTDVRLLNIKKSV